MPFFPLQTPMSGQFQRWSMRQRYLTLGYAAKALLTWKRFHPFGSVTRETNHFIMENFQIRKVGFSKIRSKMTKSQRNWKKSKSCIGLLSAFKFSTE